MQGSRPARIGDQIRAELSELLARDVKDPGIGFITITHVKVSADLQVARAYYTLLGAPSARAATAKALERATPYLRRQLAGRLRLRRAPELAFQFDETIERHQRIEALLQEIHAADAAAAPAPAAPDPAAPADTPDAGATNTGATNTDAPDGVAPAAADASRVDGRDVPPAPHGDRPSPRDDQA